jgi:hypothetical protein
MLVLPEKSVKVWNKFLEENEVLVHKFIVKQIKKHLSDNQDRIDLFKFSNNQHYAYLPKDQITVCLNSAIKIFVQHEEYEFANEAKQLIDLYHIEMLIKDTQRPANGNDI